METPRSRSFTAPAGLPRRLLVRRVSPAAVARVVAVYSLCLWVVVVLASILLWQVASLTGLVDNLESFWAQATGQSAVELSGMGLLVAFVAGGLVLVVAATLFWALSAMLLNAIWDLTGGVPVEAVADPGPEVAGPPAGGVASSSRSGL